jgi:hypothetical protein
MTAHDKKIDRHVDTLGTWHYERACTDDRPIPYTFTNKLETDQLGQPSTCEARCAIRGDLMRPGIDFDDTRQAAHTPSQSAKRLPYADAAKSNLQTESWDVPGAYSRASADPKFRQIMRQPLRSDGTEKVPGLVAVMNKVMQGAGDADRLWPDHRDTCIISWGWTRLRTEPSAFYVSKNTDFIRLVDDTVTPSRPLVSTARLPTMVGEPSRPII